MHFTRAEFEAAATALDAAAENNVTPRLEFVQSLLDRNPKLSVIVAFLILLSDFGDQLIDIRISQGAAGATLEEVLRRARQQAEQTAAECRSAARGCVDCKMRLAEGVIEHFAPLRERRAEYENDPKRLADIIHAGCERARAVAATTMEKVHGTMKIG